MPIRRVKDKNLAGYVAGEPVQPFIQTLPTCSTSTLNIPVTEYKVGQRLSAILLQQAKHQQGIKSAKGQIPVSLTQRVETKFVCYFSSIHGIGKVLLVSKNKQYSIAQLILVRVKKTITMEINIMEI
jgi:hypothetical protein